MKHNHIIPLIFILCLSALHVQAQDHFWKFDEGSGTTSVDSITSNKSFQAVLNDSNWDAYTSGSAVYLNGNDTSYVSFGNTVGQFGTKDFSVAFWMKSNDQSIFVGDILGHRTETGHGNFFSVRMTEDGYITAEVDQDASGTNYIITQSAIRLLNHGTWHYIVITRSGATLSMYVDGFASNSTTGKGVANINNGRELKLGRSLVSSDISRFSFSASFDDLAIYSGTIDPMDIFSQYVSGPSQGSATHEITSVGSYGTSHLWKLNEGTGSTSADSITSSNSFQAVLSNAYWNIYTSGSAVYLGGTDNSYVSFGNSVGQFGTHDFSVAFWMQTSDNSISRGDIIGHRAELIHGNFFSVRMTDDGTITAEIDQDTDGTNYIFTQSSVNDLNNGTWHHIVIARSSVTLSLYIDGALSDRASAAGVANINNGRALKLGRSLISSDARSSFSGTFSGVAIYSLALTPSDALALYKAGTSFTPGIPVKVIASGGSNPNKPDHVWKFTEGTGTTSADTVTLSSSYLAVLNNAYWNIYTSGAAVYLDGTNGSYVSFGNNVGQFGTQDFTVAFWIQTTDNSTSRGDLIGHRTETVHGNFFSVRMTDDGYITAEIDQDADGTNYIYTQSSVKNLNNGQSHYIVVTRYGTILSLYIDGVVSDSETANGIANINNGRELKLGRSLISSDARSAFRASFDDVAIYSVALPEFEILSYYQAGTSFSSGSLVSETSSTPETPESCWLNSYGRGIGRPISACTDGQEQNGALCYPKCNDGYTGAGPVCWQNCPSGFTDTGADCLKPGAYGRGAGYAIWDQDKCNNENSQGCEEYGLLYYPKCGDGFYAFGCCICSPNCESGMTDIGVSCQKGSYGRGAGIPLVCASGEEEDAALCYSQCKSGYNGVGPVCWGGCPAGLYQCGALCLESAAECTAKMLELALEVAKGVIEIALESENPVGVAIAVRDTVLEIAPDLNYPVCSN